MTSRSRGAILFRLGLFSFNRATFEYDYKLEAEQGLAKKPVPILTTHDRPKPTHKA
ncbi:hypothetical protein HCTV-7_gp40 [Haloarcula phage HCTV-7]|uniref:Uncharacterized protein n=3 Tax=Haloferacalesvirus hv5 TaxID=1273753 RepID=A0AAE8XU18_9CAUD|nr:hypothetical protein HCTV-7_gp40 [Haloarcula phage HCTV-7]UBF20481.1 hypothetical protein HCTV-9_gp40 [Haloarcula phage HCTV-9]UBF20597.1 hypothetical protein HCTV-11_gp40 [Haloarcula phage HCTV-11]